MPIVFLSLAVISFFSLRRSNVPMVSVILTTISCVVIGAVLLYAR